MEDKHLILVFWNLGIGGIQTRMKDVVERVAKRGVRVTILVDRRLDKEIVLPKSQNVEIIHFRDDRYKELNRPFKRLERFRFPWWLLRRIYELRPTQVVAFLNRFSVYCILVRSLLRPLGVRFRLVLNEGILTTNYLQQYERFYWKYLVKVFYKRADGVIVPTRAVKKDLVTNFRVPAEKVWVVPSWVPVSVKEQKSYSKKYDGIYVGRISPEKGIAYLVDLGEKIKKKQLLFKVAIVGEGVMSEWLKNEIETKSLGKVLFYEGFKTHDEAMHLVAQSRLFLLPSSNEGLPMTVLEANALGVPAIVLPFLGADEVVCDKKTGLISTKRKFIEQSQVLMKNKILLDKMAKESEIYVKEHHSLANLEAFIKLIFNAY